MVLRQFYQPIQPSIRHAALDMVSYQEFLPAFPLQHLIYCYWELKTVRPLTDDFCYRVVADGCVDILVELQTPEASFITGLSTSYVEFPLGCSFRYVGVRFLPTGFPQLFNVDASLLTNNFIELALLLPSTAKLIAERMDMDVEMTSIQQVFDEHFLDALQDSTIIEDGRVAEALQLIVKQQGVLNIKSIKTGLSPRQLRRKFQYYVGESPKTFSKVVRFQQLLRAKPSKQSLRYNKLFFDYGYYDQAHFIKEFKHYYGLSPAKALR